MISAQFYFKFQEGGGQQMKEKGKEYVDLLIYFTMHKGTQK